MNIIIICILYLTNNEMLIRPRIITELWSPAKFETESFTLHNTSINYNYIENNYNTHAI